jgi:hypothetical protein
LNGSTTVDIAEKSPFTFLAPAECLRNGAAVLFLALLVGLFFPGLVAWRSGIFYDRNAELKVESTPSLKDQASKMLEYKSERRSLEDAVKTLDKRLAAYAGTSPAPDEIKASIELQQNLRASLRSLNSPIIVSGFYFSSTMLLWPIIFTCLGWLAFLVPPCISFTWLRTNSKRILFFAVGILAFYRWPTWARNFIFNKEGRIFFGLANLDVDPSGFYAQELLGLVVCFLLAVIWTKWIIHFAECNQTLSELINDPIAEALNWTRISQLSKAFLHWQVSSVVLAGGFVPYLYFFWDAVLRQHDQRYWVAAITVQLLWATTWILITLPLGATFYGWRTLRAAATSAVGEAMLQNKDGIDMILDAIRELEPINPWNLATTSVVAFVSFIAPIAQHLHY